jgi:hypothetical protein
LELLDILLILQRSITLCQHLATRACYDPLAGAVMELLGSHSVYGFSTMISLAMVAAAAA